jgi:phosphate transport system permease protein
VAVPFRGGAVDVAIAEHLESIAVVDTAGRVHVFRYPELTDMTVAGIEGAEAGIRFLIGGGTLIVPGRDRTLQVAVRVPRVAVFNRSSSARRVAGRVLQPGERIVAPDDGISYRHAVDDELQLFPASSYWQVVRKLGPVPSPITATAPSHRRRGFLVGCEDGTVAMFHATSGRRLADGRWSSGPVTSLALSPRSDAVVATTGTAVVRRTVRNEHPEISFRTLFLPVWYEDHPAPTWVWQTSGGSDDFEPKYSLWPLLFGTLKATLYAMLVSVPLALLSAIYVSQLAPEWLRSVVKPSVELMAAVPSVIVGFVAALWLAPRLESFLFPAVLTVAALPLAVFVSALAVRLLPTSIRSRLPRGTEIVVVVAGGAAVVTVAVLAAAPLEEWLFAGDFSRFLFSEFGIRYDQRNALVVGLALGFAVIPIIFTVAEDACSAVPRSLIRAARALGATRWQAATRLVLPAATPGLVAAVMLGLGRAVGETMIVLMAAGNTPILDLLPVNGMRTMAAAIAFEIPEAAIGGTLYRVLFLVGCLLFVVSFAFTTTADIVGRKLRKRYARF